MKLMKASLIFILLLSLTAVARPERTRNSAFDFNLSPARANWPEHALVNVYFVRDMFSASERQTLREAMESWTKPGGTGIGFVFAGETGGLIDCERCLTITRQGVSANGRVQGGQRMIFNPIRQDQAGRLISAWIAFERSAVSSAALRTLMLQALARGFGFNDSQTARNTRQ
jgi:hypothetical protein